MKVLRPLFALAAALAAALSLPAQTPLRFAGAITLDKLIKPLAGEVGAAHQAVIELVPNGTGRGLEELVMGKAAVAMFAGDLAYFADLLNAKTPGTIDLAKLKTFPLFTIQSVLIVHPSNTVGMLTTAQIHAIFSGQTTNWKDVGGPDAPIVVALPGPTDGIRAVFASGLMKGAAFVASARQVLTATDLNKIVAQLPGAIAFVSEKNVTPEVKVVKPGDPIPVPYSLITLGEPAEPLKAVVADLQARLK